MNHRRLFLAAAAASALLAGCASAPTPADYAAEKPVLALERYFDGLVLAHGIFTDRSGKVVRRFTVRMDCTWKGDEGVLDEAFTYSDGSTQRRVWRLKKLRGAGNEGRYTGTADDVVGTAQGQAAGNAFQWAYTLRLPVDDKVYEVQFDDWMFLVDDKVMLNKAVMSKFGIRLGEVTLAFTKP
ncbi:DUF3833 domain-containing protein [Piscinibacter defluvii]|uniref:DUF3833 domain-containing protein n=1 Tax=Piscinibacter defluvii TaxID=1796922 RepID=UPI000FDDCF04|nr:DUF3833 domain-containing protein [Piscinibacter defluvii]